MRVFHRYYIIFIGYWAFSDVNLQTSHVHSPNTQKMPLKIGQNWQDQPSWGVTQLKNGKCWPWFFACSTATYHILLDKNDGKIWADKCWTCQVQFWSAVDKVDLHNFPASDFSNKLASLPKNPNSTQKNHACMKTPVTEKVDEYQLRRKHIFRRKVGKLIRIFKIAFATFLSSCWAEHFSPAVEHLSKSVQYFQPELT